MVTPPTALHLLLSTLILISGCMTTETKNRRLPKSSQGGEKTTPPAPAPEKTAPKEPAPPAPKPKQDVGGSIGCGKTPPNVGLETVTIKVGSIDRTFILVVNESYRTTYKHPLMIGYHGLGLDGTSPRRDHKWPIIEELAGDNGIFIYANSRGQSWNGGTNSEDIKFFDGIVKFMSESYCIDPKRVFVHGFSNGAFFVNSLVKQRQDSIRGVISVAGGGSGTNTAAMVIHGEADPSVGYVYAPSLLRSYASANNCSETLLDAPRETCTTFPSCDEGKPVVFCPWRGNHHWPEFSLTHVWEFIESLK